MGLSLNLRYNAPIDICLRVYYAIFYSHLINGCNLWGLTPRDKNIERVEILQNKCLRIMTFAPFNSSTQHIFNDLKLLKVRDVIKQQQLKLVFDFHRSALPEDLMSLFKLNKDVHLTNQVLNSVHNNLLHMQPINTVTYGNKSLKYHCAKLWNETFKTGTIQVNVDRKKDVKISSIESVKKFKDTIKSHFLYNYSLNNQHI
jgi:hypothetical protein